MSGKAVAFSDGQASPPEDTTQPVRRTRSASEPFVPKVEQAGRLKRFPTMGSWPQGLNEGGSKKPGMLKRTHSMSVMPLLEGSHSFASFADFQPIGRSRSESKFGKTLSTKSRRGSMLARIASSNELLEVTEEEESPPQPYILVGVLSLIFGVLSVVPYNTILRSDPGSPLFIGFATHIFFVAINAPKLREILFDRKIPLLYHLAFVTLGFIFTFLKSSAFVRLPTSMCMLLMNLQMLVAMVMQRLLFGDRYSFSQLSGCALVTIGVAIGGSSKPKVAAVGAAAASDLGADALIGIAQMFGALVALTALSMLVKVAFHKFGEAVEEQIVMQHLGALPLFVLGGQWSQIGPRLSSWLTGKDMFLVLLLVVNMSITFAGQATQVQFAGRAPNMLLVQLVDTVKKFCGLVVTALLAAPPFPPWAFWGGSAMLVLGTVQFVSDSHAHADKDGEDQDEDGHDDKDE